MCGIAGIFRFDGKSVDTTSLDLLSTSLEHRGPDGQASYKDGSVGLVHTRLAIIDLEHGQQPMKSPSGERVLVANGEIYNYIELSAELKKQGKLFQTQSDSEVLLHLYDRDMPPQSMLSLLHGMFAFALYDVREQRLLLARDRLGIKPLFYCRTSEALYFASEMKALLALLPEKIQFDANSLGQVLQQNFCSGEQTLIKGIQQLPAGCYLSVDTQGGGEVHRYWDPATHSTAQLSAEGALDVVFPTVIEQHLRADVPLGLFLSGGLDSSTLLALLRRNHNHPIHTYSVGFKSTSVHSETERAEALAKHFKTEHTTLLLESSDLLEILPDCVWAADDLMPDYANLPTALLARRAAQDVKVVFSGEGGDEVFAGYGRYRVRGPKRWLQMALHWPTRGFRAKARLSGASLDAFFQSQHQQALQDWRIPFDTAWANTPANWDTLQRMQYTDIKTWLADDLLVKADRMMMAWGLEGRVPYLDHRVVALGLALDKREKIKARQGKVAMRQWAQRLIPSSLMAGKKRGFTVPIQDLLNPQILDAMANCSDHPVIANYLRPEKVKLLIKQQYMSPQQRNTSLLWAILHLMLWVCIFIDNAGQRPESGRSVEDYLNA